MKTTGNHWAILDERLTGAADATGRLRVLLGFDGAVDKILDAVDKRHGPGDHFDALPMIAAFGERISAGAGRSANIELHLRGEKVGGNGPIMAGALAPSGVQVRYVGPLGEPELVPVFQALADKVAVTSLGQPAVTHAVEFQDGKVMLPVLTPYQQIDPECLLTKVGRDRLVQWFGEADLVCLLCWTFLPQMGSILDFLLKEILPQLPGASRRRYFFDLADPAIRTREDLAGVLQQIRAFEAYGLATLGMNLSEGTQVCAALGLATPEDEPDSLQAAAAGIRKQLGITCAMIHPTSSAVCAFESGTYFTPGPYCARPLITTGAGDHMNAGFNLGLLLDWDPLDALRLGVLFSGFYVRTGQSPSPSDIQNWIRDAKGASGMDLPDPVLS